jgi:tight adherence protein C
MIWAVVLLTAASVGLLVFGLGSVPPAEERVVRKRLASLQTGAMTYRELRDRRRRQAKRDRIAAVLSTFGEKVGQKQVSVSSLRRWLIHGGYRSASAPAIYVAARTLTAAALSVAAFFVTAFFGLSILKVWVLTALAAGAGFMLPYFYIDGRVSRRKQEVGRALPDTLDLLVVCMEAGLGLNQALVRVAEEIERISPEMGDELTVVNLEIRAGTPRDEALRNLGERTGVEDVRALTSMLVQTDRFGTSVADSLRVHAETLRTKRMQRAEEKAAKTTVKMLFPLVLFIFPAIFVVLLGPAYFLLQDLFGNM